LEYLDESEFFHKYKDKIFNVEENHKLKGLFNNTKKYKKSLLLDLSDNDNITLELDDILDINNNINIIDNSGNKDNLKNLELTYENLNFNNMNIENDDNKNNNEDDNEDGNEDDNEDNNENDNEDKEGSSSTSSCSSRTSNTENENNSESSAYSDEDSEPSSSSSSEEEIICTIEQFPVEIIALEGCENTLDSYIVENKIKDNEWESIILQIIFTLITYQKTFEFTHNDLHTNNIVYISTEKKYLYYKYNNKHYKVPTFGKIYKIIDFGRAIYKFKNIVVCSDSYASDGDANTQYNCEPYFNTDKPRLDPNYSFDLCRLGCSLFDYFIDDLDDIRKLKSPIKKTMIEWVFDDKNRNILYKNNGDERYPDFKLYKMIARTVHNHTPQKCLKKDVFEKYVVSKKNINNKGTIFNIDILPTMTS
jgi:hypothetical protein